MPYISDILTNFAVGKRIQMKATKDFFIHDNEVRLSAESEGGSMCAAPARYDKSVSQDVCFVNIVRGRIGVIPTLTIP